MCAAEPPEQCRDQHRFAHVHNCERKGSDGAKAEQRGRGEIGNQAGDNACPPARAVGDHQLGGQDAGGQPETGQTAIEPGEQNHLNREQEVADADGSGARQYTRAWGNRNWCASVHKSGIAPLG